MDAIVGGAPCCPATQAPGSKESWRWVRVCRCSDKRMVVHVHLSMYLEGQQEQQSQLPMLAHV